MTFDQFARENGVMIDRYYPTARIQYAPTRLHPKEKRGSWKWFGDRGWVCAHDEGSDAIWFNDPSSKPWAEADKARWRQEQAQRSQEIEQGHREAAERAGAVLRACKTEKHGYLRLKGFPDMKALVAGDDALVVPMRDVKTDALLGVQRILWDPEERIWHKRMTPGMRAGGAVHWIGPPKAQEVWLVEGYATGLSVAAAAELTRLSARVCVTFSASNLEKVSSMIKGQAYVFADNDRSGRGEEAARRSQRPWCMAGPIPEGEKSYDANDQYLAEGIYEVASKLMEVRNARPVQD